VKKFTSFCPVLKRCTQKKIGSFFLPHGVYFQIKYTEAILSKGARKQLRFENIKMPIAVLKINLLRHLLQFSAHSFAVAGAPT